MRQANDLFTTTANTFNDDYIKVSIDIVVELNRLTNELQIEFLGDIFDFDKKQMNHMMPKFIDEKFVVNINQS